MKTILKAIAYLVVLVSFTTIILVWAPQCACESFMTFVAFLPWIAILVVVGAFTLDQKGGKNRR